MREKLTAKFSVTPLVANDSQRRPAAAAVPDIHFLFVENGELPQTARNRIALGSQAYLELGFSRRRRTEH
jgi:hypothetical protein